MASPPPFLKIAGELCNAIYELVISDTSELKLFEGRVTLPALGCVCRQMRTEMRGMFETHETELITAALTGLIPIVARVINYDFTPLHTWLHSNECLPNETEYDSVRKRQVRTLHITMVIDLPLIDPKYAAESELSMRDRIARDRKAIQCFNDSWDDSHLQPPFWGHKGPTDFSDLDGVKSYALKTLAPNCYVCTCDVRFNYFSTADDISSESFPSGFCYESDYLCRLFGMTFGEGWTWYSAHEWGSCASPFFKLIFGAISRARSASTTMLWHTKYSRLTREQRATLNYYRLRDGGFEMIRNLRLAEERVNRDHGTLHSFKVVEGPDVAPFITYTVPEDCYVVLGAW